MAVNHGPGTNYKYELNGQEHKWVNFVRDKWKEDYNEEYSKKEALIGHVLNT